MLERRLDILGICETRLMGSGSRTIHNNYQLMYSGGEVHRHGVGVMLTEEMAQRVESVDYGDERMMMFSIKMEHIGISVIQVYAPQQGRPEAEKEEFYRKLQETKNRSPYAERMVIMGDLNGHVGTQRRGVESVIGAFSVGERNRAGERVIDFCLQNGMTVMNTCYKHRESHKWTWYRWSRERAEYMEKSMIDLILTNKKEMFRDVKSVPSVSGDADHRMVLGKMILKKPTLHPRKMRRRVQIERIKEAGCKENYQQQIRNNMTAGEEEQSVEECWNAFKEAVLKSAEETMGIKMVGGTKKKKTPWWTERVKTAVSEKMRCFRKWIKTRGELERREYVEARRESDRVKRMEKETTWEKIGNELEEDVTGVRKLVFNIAKNYRKSSTPMAKAIKDENGVLIVNQREIDERWKRFFEGLYNVEGVAEERLREPDLLEAGGEEEWLITEEEMMTALRGMKSGKAAGEDGIVAEMLKEMGDEGTRRMLKLMNSCWRDEIVPCEWSRATICPIYKKGDKTECGNYRGIALMSHPAKVYERILERRLREVVEEKLEEWQHGFRPGRSSIDLVFALKMISEKNWEFNRKTYAAFVDLEKAFDRVPRELLWRKLRGIEYGIPEKLLKAIKSTYTDSKCRVKTTSGEGKWFDVTTGVKQGSVLSPILFIIYMDSCGRSVRNRVEDEMFGYADDLVLFAQNQERLQSFLEVWEEELEERGMRINRGKTEVMLIGGGGDVLEVSLSGERLRQTDQFKYLGVHYGEENDTMLELNKRIGKFNGTTAMLFPLLKERAISRRVKMVMYTSILRPILMYGHEAWALNTRAKSKLEACEMRVLRLIRGVTRRDRKRNEEVRADLGVSGVVEIVERGQLRWYGHVKRMEEQRVPRRYLEWIPEGRRSVGRPKVRWSDNVNAAMVRRGSSVHDVEASEMWMDRRRWKGFVQNN
jgi:hypothetical protein